MKKIIEAIQDNRSKPLNSKMQLKLFIKDILITNPNIEVDWDEWSGEKWASLFIRGEKFAIICAELPVVFILKEKKELIKNINSLCEHNYIEIKSFVDNMWMLDKNEFEQKIPQLIWHASDEAINVNKFSTDDFWFATI